MSHGSFFLGWVLHSFNTKCLSCSHRQTNIGVLGALILTIFLSLHMDVNKNPNTEKGLLSQGRLQIDYYLWSPFPVTSSGRSAIRVWQIPIQKRHLEGTTCSVISGFPRAWLLHNYIISWCHDEWYIRTDDPMHSSHRRWKNSKHGKRTSFQLRR